ncbi:hypothetical protein U9M48_012976 [Paspalum notatum var. saurae]|uniref:Transposase n=1 Tax=Paspalum notatum var. saurae TaxID=547442 RepID=A0AAQ3WIV2_PASNO
MYPDVVDTINGMKPVLSWEDFKKTSTNGISNDKRVLAEFWWRFKCLPEHREEADEVLELKFKNIVPKMLSEQKQAVMKNLYRDGNVPPEDVDKQGNRWPTKEALISAKPRDFTTDEGWRLLCEHWSTPEFRKSSRNGSINRQSKGEEMFHRGGSRSLPATRQFLALKTGVDPGLGGAWLHNHELNRGINDGRLCNQSATDKWAQYEEGMEKKHGPNWKVEHPDLDGAVIYESVGRMPHGKLAIADGAISITEKEAIKTRKRSAQPYATAREKRLERDNEQLRNENSALQEVQRVLRALVAKGGMDYDALAQGTTTNLKQSKIKFGNAA